MCRADLKKKLPGKEEKMQMQWIGSHDQLFLKSGLIKVDLSKSSFKPPLLYCSPLTRSGWAIYLVDGALT